MLVRIRTVCLVGMGAVEEASSSGTVFATGVPRSSWLAPGVGCVALIGVVLPGTSSSHSFRHQKPPGPALRLIDEHEVQHVLDPVTGETDLPCCLPATAAV